MIGARVGAVLAMLMLCAAGPVLPGDSSQLAWRTVPGASVPLDVMLRDEAGKLVPLRSTLNGTPVILDLGYYHCPSLCGVVRADLFNALAESGLVGGRDYTLLALSIDPAETPRDAAEAKASDLARSKAGGPGGWHYLTGSAASIEAVVSAVGFHARYDPALRQFLHPAGLVVLTAGGVVSGYLLGVGYSGGAVVRARNGGIEQDVLPVLLLCFHYDPVTGRYTLAIEKVLRLTGLLTVATLGGLMFMLHRRYPGA